MTISFRDVSFAYESFGSPSSRAPGYQLRDLGFQISSHELVAIVGRSGSGKSTLLQMFNGLLAPARGEVWVDGKNIHAKGYDLAGLRRRIGLAFQFPEVQLFAATVAEDVAFAPTQQRLAPREIEKRTRQALAQTGLSENFLERNPLTLSEGEKRRAAFAGILALEPEMLVLDEPTASLDARGVAEVKALLRQWHHAGKGIVMISHDADLVAELAQRVLVLHEGAIVFDGAPQELWRDEAASRALCARAGLATPRAIRLRHLLAQRGGENFVAFLALLLYRGGIDFIIKE
jgi:energy-coupling factor transport system ATP-binding protein